MFEVYTRSAFPF